MNRLCLGALGLLLALSATCFAKDIILEDFKDQSGYVGPSEDEYKMTQEDQDNLIYLLRNSSAVKYQFVIEATRLLYGRLHKSINKDQQKNANDAEARIMKVLESMNTKYITENRAAYTQLSQEEKLEALETNKGENLDDYKNRKNLRYEAARLYHYLIKLNRLFLKNIKRKSNDAEFKQVLKYVGRYQEMAHEHKDVNGYSPPDPISLEEASKHSLVDWNKDKWDEIYSSLPTIKKYLANGLNPRVKERLNQHFKSLDSNKDYNMKKAHSQKHIDHIAIQARLEAIKHSHTAAGKYFATHESWIAQQLEKIDCEMTGCDSPKSKL